MGNAVYEKLLKCKEAVRKVTDFEPDVALVLGSGLGGFAENIKIETEISYSDIPGFPVSTVPGHAGKFIFGYLGEPTLLFRNLSANLNIYKVDLKQAVYLHLLKVQGQF